MLIVASVAAWWLAGNIWQWTLPAIPLAPYRSEISPTVAAKDLASRHTFGTATASSQGNQGSSLENTDRMRLMGVIFSSQPAETGAVIAINAQQPVFVRLGGEVTQGRRLVSVSAREVEIEGGGQRQRIGLPEKALPVVRK